MKKLFANFLGIAPRTYNDWQKTHPNICFLFETVFEKKEDFLFYGESDLLLKINDVKEFGTVDKELLCKLLGIKKTSLVFWQNKRPKLFKLIKEIFGNSNEDLKFFLTNKRLKNRINTDFESNTIKAAAFIKKINPNPTINFVNIFDNMQKKDEIKISKDFKIEDYFVANLPFINSQFTHRRKEEIENMQIANFKTNLLCNDIYSKFRFDDFLKLAHKLEREPINPKIFNTSIDSLFLYAIEKNDLILIGSLLLMLRNNQILFTIIEYYFLELNIILDDSDKLLNISRLKKITIINIYKSYKNPVKFKRKIAEELDINYSDSLLAELINNKPILD